MAEIVEKGAMVHRQDRHPVVDGETKTHAGVRQVQANDIVHSSLTIVIDANVDGSVLSVVGNVNARGIAVP